MLVLCLEIHVHTNNHVKVLSSVSADQSVTCIMLIVETTTFHVPLIFKLMYFVLNLFQEHKILKSERIS